MWEYLIFSLIAAIPTIASIQPIPEPSPYDNDCPKEEKSFSCMKRLAPRMAQFTAISGRKMPYEE